MRYRLGMRLKRMAAASSFLVLVSSSAAPARAEPGPPRGMQWAVAAVDHGFGSWTAPAGQASSFSSYGGLVDANLSVVDYFLMDRKLVHRFRVGEAIVVRGSYERISGVRSTFAGTDSVSGQVGLMLGFGAQGAYAVNPDVDVFASLTGRAYSGHGRVADESIGALVLDVGARWDAFWLSGGVSTRVQTVALRWAWSDSGLCLVARYERLRDNGGDDAHLSRLWAGVGFAY
jgi:hypothetical protein